MITKEDIPQLEKLVEEAARETIKKLKIKETIEKTLLIVFGLGFVLGVIITSFVAWLIP